MIRIFDKKVTANQLAKWMVYDKGSNAEFWGEDCLIDLSEFTEKEITAVDIAISKHVDRLRKFFGIDKLNMFNS